MTETHDRQAVGGLRLEWLGADAQLPLEFAEHRSEMKMDAKTDDKGAGKCPFTGATAAGPTATGGRTSSTSRCFTSNSTLSDPMGKDFDYAEEFKKLDLDALIKDLHALMTDFAGLVAGRLRSLWRPVHPHGVAQRGHLPHHRRPRRRRGGSAAFRAAQLLAGQRQPRQGAPAAVADQAEIRPQDLLGRPDDPHRQRRAGIHGLQDLRFRRRPRRRLGARRDSTGAPREPGWATSATAASASFRAARRRADGPDLRQPGRAERQSGPDRGGKGHPRDLLPHGDERRGNRCADRRRPLLRQDPWRRRSVAGRSRAGRRRASRTRASAGRASTAPVSAPTPSPAARKSPGRRRRPVEQSILQEPVRKRMGADEEPGRRLSVEGEERGGNRPGCLRPPEEAPCRRC